MKVVPLDSDLEPLFWEHAYTDIPLYYFFILDMKHESVKTLLTRLDIGKVEIQGHPEHKPLISEKFKKVNKTMEIFVMTLRKGEETLQIGHPVERLSHEDAEDIAVLLKQADPG